VAAQRLGQQRPGHGRMVQRGRVELDELDVGRRHPGPQRHGHAVAGGLGRVGGHREELAGPAGGQHHVVGPHLDRPPSGQGQHARQRPPSTRRSRANHPRARRWPSGRWRRPGPAPPRRRWPPRRRARRGPGVAALAGQGQHPVASRSNSTPRAISSWTRPGPSSTSIRTASSSHSPAPAASVSARCRSVESSSPPSTAATPPWAQRVADWDSTPLVRHADPQGRPPPGPASRTAADRPATPLPRTRTSKGPGRAGRWSRRFGQGELGVEAGRHLVDHPVAPVDVHDAGHVGLELGRARSRRR
jgi:hypothetical protein